MLIQINVSKDHSVKSYTDLGWTDGASFLKTTSPTYKTSIYSGVCILSWPHEDEPIFPDNAKYIVLD